MKRKVGRINLKRDRTQPKGLDLSERIDNTFQLDKTVDAFWAWRAGIKYKAILANSDQWGGKTALYDNTYRKSSGFPRRRKASCGAWNVQYVQLLITARVRCAIRSARRWRDPQSGKEMAYAGRDNKPGTFQLAKSLDMGFPRRPSMARFAMGTWHNCTVRGRRRLSVVWLMESPYWYLRIWVSRL